MRNSTAFKNFMASLTEQQNQEYRDMSINQQKDWYITWLENQL